MPDGTLGSISLTGNIYARNPNHPLDGRGWALQEFLLSPRVLMYGEKELTWHYQTENFKPVVKHHLSYFEGVKRLPPGIFCHQKACNLNIQKQQTQIWASIIEQYSKRRLTHSKDKLPAISGIAK
jgi:hypothetical protein